MPRKIDKKWVFSDKELGEMIDRAEDSYEEYIKDKPVATSFRFDPETRIFSIRAKDRSRIDFPVSKIKELRKASDKEIRSAYITKAGDAIHWDELDAHYTVAGLAANIFGTKEWMKELAKIGGRSTSDAKAIAARLNGQKGGRPPLSSQRSTTVYRSAAVGGSKSVSKASSSPKSRISQKTGSARSSARKK